MPRQNNTRRRHLTFPTTSKKDWSTRPFHRSISFRYYSREIDKPAYIEYTSSELNLQVQKYLQGDDTARNQIISHCVHFAAHIALRYAGLQVPVSDLIQCANLGLIMAVDDARAKFNPNLGSFLIFASNYIRQELYNVFARERTIVSSKSSAKSIKVRSAFLHLVQVLEREPSVEELSEYTELSADEVVKQLVKTRNDGIIYLEQPVAHNDSDGFTIISRLQDKSFLAPDDYTQIQDDLIYYQGAINHVMAYLKGVLKTRDYAIFCCYYGLTSGGIPKKMIDIAFRYGVKKQRVDQILKRIWRDKKISRTMNSRWFAAVIEHVGYLHEQIGNKPPVMDYLQSDKD